jgi:D-alanyl-D-alanine carboxypeptidase/D-alanyl-D-alanine-endopeptidase (penicillin-binding protein 4)
MQAWAGFYDPGMPIRTPTLSGCLALSALCAFAFPDHAAAAELPEAVQAALDAAHVPDDAVSMLVVPLTPGVGSPRLAHQVDTPRQVASVMKLFTTGGALRLLGPAFTWHTDVGLGGPLRANGTLEGPLFIRADGDPGLLPEHLRALMMRWRAAGLRRIHGDIVIDRDVFDVPAHDPSAFDGQGLKPYNAGPDAFLLNYQALTLRFTPDAGHPGQVRVSMEPLLQGVRLQARLSTPPPSSTCGDWRESLSLALHPDTGRAPQPATYRPPADDRDARGLQGLRPWRIELSGPYPLACGEKDWSVLWQGDGPNDYATRLLAQTWRELGGRWDGTVRSGGWPAGLPVWQSWTSPPLGEQISHINKFSNNVMARQLFLTLARAGGQAGPATLTAAQSVLKTLVEQATRDAKGPSPCMNEALVLDNGSGLSRQARSSAACLGRWIESMWASPWMPEWLASLPISGMDGTARRMHSVAGRAHVKTGSLDGVAALAGVVEGDSGARYGIVGIINHPQADAARPALEALVGWTTHDEPTTARH